MPLDTVSLNAIKTRILIVFIIALVLFILTIINSYISSRITDPIKELEKFCQSDRGRKSGNRSLYRWILRDPAFGENPSRTWQGQIKRLMDDIVAEHESKRKNASLIRYSPRSIPFPLQYTGYHRMDDRKLKSSQRR